MKIDANKFKECLSILGLAVSKNISDRPITRTVELTVTDNVLWGYSCDKLNNIQLKICDTTEDFSIVVDYATLYDVVKNCEGDIEIKTKKDVLSIKTNTMSCKLPSRSSNDNTKMPRPIWEEDKAKDIDFSEIEKVLPLSKTIIDPNFTVNAYRNICFNENVMVSDTSNAAILKKNIFGMENGEYVQFILRQESVDILNILGECKYHTTEHQIPSTNRKCKFLHIRNNDETMFINIIPDTMSNEYQYEDIMDLFNIDMKYSIVIDHDILAKAYTLSKLFLGNTILLFNNDGVTLKVEESDFSYNITDAPCDTYTYTITESVMKKLLSIKGDIKLYFDENPFFKCVFDDREMIIGVDLVE